MQATQTVPQQSAEFKPKLPLWLKIVLIVTGVFFIGGYVLMIALVAITTLQATSKAQVVSSEFVNAMQANDGAAAYELTSSNFKTSTSEYQLQSTISGVSPALQGEESVTGKEIRKESGNPTHAIIMYEVSTDAGKTYIQVTLEEEDQNWRVLNFRSSETPLESELEE